MIRRTDYQTKNRAYQAGREILVKGIVLHSYGTPRRTEGAGRQMGQRLCICLRP